MLMWFCKAQLKIRKSQVNQAVREYSNFMLHLPQQRITNCLWIKKDMFLWPNSYELKEQRRALSQ